MKRNWLILMLAVLLLLPAFAAQADAPVLSATTGLYEGSVTVEINAAGTDAIIYTLDGSVPTEANAQVYTQPLVFTETTALRVRTATGGELGEIVSETYIIDTHTKLDIVAVIIDPAELWDDELGLFAEGKHNILHLDPFDPNATFWKNTDSPRNAAVAYISRTSGDVLLNERVQLSTERSSLYGMYIAQKSFTVTAEDGRFEAPLFDGSRTVFTSLRLDNGGMDGTFTRVASQTQTSLLREHMDTDMLILQRSPVAVYLNGEYWGQYWLTETFDPLVICQHEGISLAYAPKIEMTNSLRDIQIGAIHYRHDGMVTRYVFDSLTWAGPEVIRAYVNTYFDVDSMLDWYAAEVFFGDMEGPDYAFYRLPDGRWKAAIMHFDSGLFYAAYNSPQSYLNGLFSEIHGGKIFALLMSIPEYRDAFLTKLGALWQKLPTMEMRWALDESERMIIDEMPYHFMRWAPEHSRQLGDWPQESYAAMAYWQKRISRMSNLTMVARPFYVYYYTQHVFGLTDEEMLHYFGSPMPPEPYGFEGR